MKLIRCTFKYILKYYPTFIVLILSAMIRAVIAIILPFLSGSFIDQLLADTNVKTIYTYAGIYVFIALIQIVSIYTTSILQTSLFSNASFNLTDDITKHMQRLPLHFYTNKDITYLCHKIQNDANTIISFGLNNALDLIVNIVSMIGTFYIVMSLNSFMFFIFIAALLIYLVQYAVTKKILYSSTQSVREIEAHYFSTLQSQLKNLKLIKIFNKISFFKNKLYGDYNKLYKSRLKLQKVSCLFQSNQIIISSIFRVVLIVFGGFQFINGNISIGNFSVLLSYLGLIMNSAIFFANLGQVYVSALVSFNRIQELDKIEEERGGTNTIEQITSIDVSNLSYGYDKKMLIKNFSCSFEKGKIYCLSGMNGIGKSTFLDIISGLYQSYEGTVLYNQRYDIKNLDMYFIREDLCSFVSQDALLYEDSIYNNIILGSKTDNRNKVVELAEEIGLFIEKENSLTLDYFIDNNRDNLSGGEKQKINLLRSFIEDRDLFVFDEPTSFLDNPSREIFMRKVKELKAASKIIIIITHDIELQNMCDIIINLENTVAPNLI